MPSLRDVDLSLKLDPGDGARRLAAAQRRLLALRLVLGGLIGEDRQLGPPLCVLFEGWDASGKGGAIRRLTSPLDPRHVRVTEFAAPTESERRHHFLHRFAPALPGWGGMAVLDRTWYGRVLVERVEGFAGESEWRRAYPQIVDFERALATEGAVVVKFWLHVSEAEQRRRFHQREQDPLKRWKLTSEDWRNLARRSDYEAAVEEMFDRTDHPQAPWRLIAAESKHYARVAVIETVIDAVTEALRASGREPGEIDAVL
jgi:polyphosphate kinase 2 (PPK2 family)